MSDSLKEVLYLTTEQFEELRTNGTITVDNQTITYKPNEVIYITPDDTNEKLDLVEMEAQGLVTEIEFNSFDGVTGAPTATIEGIAAIEFPDGSFIKYEETTSVSLSELGIYKFYSLTILNEPKITLINLGGFTINKIATTLHTLTINDCLFVKFVSGASDLPNFTVNGSSTIITILAGGFTFNRLDTLNVTCLAIHLYGNLFLYNIPSTLAVSMDQGIEGNEKIIVPYEFLEDYKTALPDYATYIDAYVLASSLNTEETETYRIYAHNIWLSFTYEDETSGSVDFTVYTSSNTSLKTPEVFYNALGYIKVCAVGTPSAAFSECYFAVTMTTTDGYYFTVNGKKITVKSITDSIHEV